MVGLVNVDVGGIAGGLFNLVDQLFTSDEEREAAKLKLLQLEQDGQLAQIQVNLAEAQHESMFVAGWRPFIGWVCGAAFAYSFLLQPFFSFITWAVYSYNGKVIPFDTLPVLDVSALMTALFGLLGLGGMRSWEKLNKANKNR